MKKILGFIFGLFLLLSLGLAGCGDIYGNMKMVVMSDDEITIFIQNDIDEEGQELVDNGNVDGEPTKYFLNTASIDIEISGVEDKVSKSIIASSSDRTKLRIDSIVLKDNVSTLTLVAIQPGVVNVKIQSAEGGQTKTLKVNIVQVIDSISIASDYKFGVMANGVPQKFDESKILQNPSNSSFSEFYYEAKNEVQGVIVSPNGYITATQKTADFVTLVIRPKYASSQEVFAEYIVPIFSEIKEEDLAISSNGEILGDSGIEIIKNKDSENVKSISLNASSTAPSTIASEIKNLKIDATILDASIAVVLNQTNNSLDIVGIHTGRTTITFKVTLKDFPNVEILQKKYSIYVRDVATTISLYSQNSNTINVYNLTSSNTKGVELVANVYPDTASNRKYKIEVPEEIKDKIKVLSAFGVEYDLSTALFTSGQKLFIHHDGSLINETVQITLVSNDEASSATLTLNLNLYLYIENIITDSSEFLYVYDGTSGENKYELDYQLNPIDANKSLVSIVSSNPSVLEVEFSEAEETHFVKLNGVGKARLYFYANGKLLKTCNAEVVSQLKAMLANVDSPTQNSSVSQRTRQSVSYGSMIVGQTTESAVIKVGKKVKISVSNYPETAKIARTEFSIESAKDKDGITIPTNSVSVDANGYVRATTAISEFHVVIESYGYILDEATHKVVVNSEPEKRTIIFTAILPITDVKLNAVYKEIYDINTVGYAEAELAKTHLKLTVLPENATVDVNDISWTVIPTSYSNIIEVQPDGSAIITGRLGNQSGNQATITVRAIVREYDVVMSRECTIVIKKANQVSDILLENYDSSVGAYLKYSSLEGDAFVPDIYQIQATAMPLDATNRGLDYFAFDIEEYYGTVDDDSILKLNGKFYTKSPAQRISVNSAGIVSTKPGASGGYSIVYVVPRDNISEDGVFKESEIKKSKILLFDIADGTIDNPFRIRDVDELLSMKSALDANYVLANNINLDGISDFQSIGSFDKPFNGHLSGKLAKIDGSGSYLRYSINNFNLNIQQTQYADISEEDLIFGLFGYIGESGVVEDLTITVSSINISAILKKDLTFGVLSAYNYGTILNCEVRIKNDVAFNLSALKANDAISKSEILIGMLVGVNAGTIGDESNNSNSIVVCDNDSKITIKNYDDYDGIIPPYQTIVSISNGAIGGLVGLNGYLVNENFKGSIYGVFKYSGDLLDESSQTYEIEFNVDYNKSSVNSNITLISELENVCLGGVVGQNDKLVQSVSFAGSVSGIKNVGGIIGVNNANALHLLSYGYIQNSLDNVDIENIGGVVGHNTSSGSISFAMFEVYEATTHIDIQSNADVENVGGVVGYNEGNILYSYSYSYTAQKDNNTNFDIKIDATTITNVGGFVGCSSNSISISFSNVAISVSDDTSVGNFTGSNNGSIIDCYSIGYINTKPSTIEQTKIGFDENKKENWTDEIDGRNYDLPMLKIKDTNPEEVLLTEAPKELTISKTYNDFGKHFYKVADKKVILMLNVPASDGDMSNKYALSDLIKVTVVPLSNRTRSLIAEVIKGNSISIVGGDVIAIGEGASTIKIYSPIDPTVYDILEVYVVKGVTDISISNAINNEIHIMKDQSIQLNIQNLNGDYQSLSMGGWRYAFSANDYAELNYQKIEDYVYVSGEYLQLLTALEATSELTDGYLVVNISPYVIANFQDGTTNKFVFTNIEYTLKLYIYKGLQGISLNKTIEQIMPSADGLITVTLDTDLETDFVDSITIYKDSLDNKLGVYEFEAGGKVYKAEAGKENPKFELEVFSSSFDEVNKKQIIVFRIIPFRNIGDFEETENYIFEFSSTNTSSEKTYTKQLDLTIYPQEIQSATIKYFNDGEEFDANLQGAGEIESNNIIIGQYGLVKVNLYPIYSVYSKLTIQSSLVSGESASFQQVYYNPKSDNYAERVRGSALIDSGITLVRISNRYLDADTNEFVTNFDGNIYIKALLGSNVGNDLNIVFTLKAYDENDNIVYTTSITLITQSLPYLKVDLSEGVYDGLVPKGIKDNDGFKATIRYEAGESYRLELYNSLGNPVNISWNNIDSSLAGGIKTDVIKIFTKDLTSGEKYTLFVKTTKSSGSDTSSIQVSLEFKVVNFVITGINLIRVDDGHNENAIIDGKFSYPLRNSGYNIRIELDTIGADASTFEEAVNKSNIWQYFNFVNNQFESIILGDDEFVKANFRLKKKDGQDGGWILTGNSIANVDILKAVLTYYYDSNGNAIISTSYSNQEFWQELSFNLNFSIASSKDHPLPISTKEEFLAMQEGIDYILLADIDFSKETEKFEPISTKISSLDGNGKKIIISGFNNEFDSSSIKVGLFSEVSENTILKNIILQVNSDTSLDLSNYSDINFGYIAGVNNGTITNAEVTSYYDSANENDQKIKYNSTIITSQSSQQSTITAYIGGLVGTNNGVITNSRVDNIKLTTSGIVGGFVALNGGTISSSYTNKVALVSTAGVVGGFVATNTGNAKIFTSYAKGEWVDSASLRADVLSIDAIGNAGGFVHTNSAMIRDCYSNLKIRSQSRSGGFVYNQTNSGNITNCISYSDVIQNSIAHMPFVATGTNNRFQNQGVINNSFFYMENEDVFVLKDIANNESGAQHLNRSEFSNPEYLPSFAFDGYVKGSNEENSEYNGVWVIPNSQDTYTYFTSGNGFISGVPELVDANIIAKSIKILDRTEIVDDMPVYIYAFDVESGKEYGSLNNPYLIADVDDFVYYFVEMADQDTLKNNKHIRLIKDISFSEYDQKLQTTKIEYSGIFNGNGLSLNAISLSAEIGYNGQNFGLFNKLTYSTSNDKIIKGVIKNLDVNFNEVKASQTPIVGGLVGVVDGGLLANITVSGQDVAVKGSNIVGGVAGLVKGSSRLFNVHSKISANAGYRIDANSDNKPIVYFDDADYKDMTGYENQNRTLSNSTQYVSYAGAVAGVVDTKIRNSYDENLRYPSCYDIYAGGNIKVVASTAGGLFGLVGFNTTVSNARFTVEIGQFINGEKIQGGVVGELRGKLEQSYIAHDDTTQSVIDACSYGLKYDRANTTLFKENSKTQASGGLVGFNFGGSIIDCYAKVDVRNKMSQSAGGLVGASISGEIKAVFASGSVCGYRNIGGLIGELISVVGQNVYYYYDNDKNYLPLEMLVEIDGNKISSLQNPTIKFNAQKSGEDTYDDNSITILYVVAGNNWYPEDISYNSSATKNWGGILGYYPNTLVEEYIQTMHPTEDDQQDNLINFYVASKNGSSNQFIYGNKSDYASGAVGNKDCDIASAIAYDDLKYANKDEYFGGWNKYVWDLSNTGKFPILNPKIMPAGIEIATVSDLLQIQWKLDGDYILVSDIDLRDIAWLPLGTEQNPFCGTFTSAGYYTIKNLSMSGSNKYYGLFGYTSLKETIIDNEKYYSQCKITNINLTVKDIDATSAYTDQVYVGALVAYSNGTYIGNCTVSNSTLNNLTSPGIRTNSSYVGGLVGYSTISPEFTGYIEGASFEKVTDAYFESTIQNCASKVDIYIVNPSSDSGVGTQIFNVGGLVGYIYSITKISKSWTEQNIIFDISNDGKSSIVIVGGFIGANAGGCDSTISECFSNTNIINKNLNEQSVNSTIGGFIGQLDSSLYIDHCFSAGTIIMKEQETTSTKPTLGGFVGQLNNVEEKTVDGKNIKNLMNNYSICTFENFVDGCTIGGFVGSYPNDISDDFINDSKNFYDLSMALLEEDSLFISTPDGIRDAFNNSDAIWQCNKGCYYPVLSSYSNSQKILGNDRKDFCAFESFRQGSKINPYRIENVADFNAMADNQSTMYLNYLNDEMPMIYNYYIQLGNIDLSSQESNHFKDNNYIIEHFYGFYNGANNIISNFKLTSLDGSIINPYNIGLFGELMSGSVISYLGLSGVDIEIYSQKATNNPDEPAIDAVINVGGLVGLVNSNTTLFGISIDLSSKITVVPYGNEQTVNVGGIAGSTDGTTRIIYCISYANIASFDYRIYNEIYGASNPLQPKILNMGSIVGLYQGGRVINVFSIGELHYTNADQFTRVGNLFGGIEGNTKLQNFYSVNTVFNTVNKLKTDPINYYNVPDGSSITISEFGKISTPLSSENVLNNFKKNYGYSIDNFGILSKRIPDTISTISTESAESKDYYSVITAAQLIELLKVDVNISLKKDIFFNNEYGDNASYIAGAYSAIFEGNGHTIFNLNTSLFNEFSGTLQNVQIKSTTTDNSVMNSIVEGATINTVSAPYFSVPDQITPSDNFALYHFSNKNSSEIDEVGSWINLGGTTPVLRAFVEYWDKIDLRCVYIKIDTILSEEINNQLTDVEYFGIYDKYQLSKLLSTTEFTKSENKYAIYPSNNYDFSGKIWSGFKTFGATFKGIVQNNAIPTFENIYVEGTNDVGFINSASGAFITNINFINSRIVLYDSQDTQETQNYNNFGTVIARAENTIVTNIKVIDTTINADQANYVGGCFGSYQGTLQNISIESTANPTEKIKGLNYVGGIAGKFINKVVKADFGSSENFSNNYKVQGNDVVGGLFGVLRFDEDSLVKGKQSGNNGEVYGRNFVGGIAGFSNAFMSEFVNNGEVKSSGYFVGGICGYNDYVIHKSINHSSVTTVESTNNSDGVTFEDLGINGISLSAINSDFSDTSIKPGYFFGGIAGVNAFYISASENLNSAQISAKSFVGGIAGLNIKVITGNDITSANTAVNGTICNANIVGETFVGGIAGYNSSEAEINSVLYDIVDYNDNGLHGLAFIGGITGYNDGWIINASAINSTSNVIELNAYYIGGIAGFNTSNGRIQSVNSAMQIELSGSQVPTMSNDVLSIEGISYNYLLGGIVAQNDGSIIMSASQGVALSRQSGFTENNISIGGISAVNNGEIDRCFAYSDSFIKFYYNSDESSSEQSSDKTIYLGGIVAQNNQYGKVTSSYSLLPIETINGNNTNVPYKYVVTIGGLVASNQSDGVIMDSYALNSVWGQNDNNAIDYQSNELYYVVLENAGTGNEKYVLPNNDDNVKNGYNEFVKNNFALSLIRPLPKTTNNIFEKDENYENYIKAYGIDYYIDSKSVWSGYTSGDKLTYNYTYDIDSIDDWFVPSESQQGKYELKSWLNGVSENDFVSHLVEASQFPVLQAKSRSVIFFHKWTNQTMLIDNNSSSAMPENLPVSKVVSSGFNGEGTSSKPYLISGISDFATINYYLEHRIKDNGEKENFKGVYFKLVNDIDLSSAGNFFIGSDENPFDGIIDGDNHTISYLSSDVGFLNKLGEDGKISNITFLNPKIVGSGKNDIGTVAGINYGTIENVKVISNDNLNYYIQGGDNVGTICGTNEINGTISKCQSYIKVIGDENVGGICGLNNWIVTMSETLGPGSNMYKTEGTINVGGIVGYNTKIISQCACRNYVVGNENVGGIVGYQKIDASSEAGGGTGGIDNCLFIGNILCNNGSKTTFGGIVGYCESGAVQCVICAGTLNGFNEIYGGWDPGSSTDPQLNTYVVAENSVENPSNPKNKDITVLSSNKMIDVARRGINFAGFGMNNEDSVWGMVVNTIDNGNYSSNYNYPLLKNLVSSQNLNFSYAPFNGAGTSDNPYYIENQAQFTQLVGYINSTDPDIQAMYNTGKNYKIDVSVYKKEYDENQTDTFTYGNWTPTKDWKCVLDGNDATIELGTIGVVSEEDINHKMHHYCGFASKITRTGKIKNLTLNIGSFDIYNYIYNPNNPTDDSSLKYSTNLYCGGVAGLVTEITSYPVISYVTTNISDTRTNGWGDVGTDSGGIYLGRYIGKNVASEPNEVIKYNE